MAWISFLNLRKSQIEATTVYYNHFLGYGLNGKIHSRFEWEIRNLCLYNEMRKDSLSHHILSLIESNYFKHSNQRWKDFSKKQYFSGWVSSSWGNIENSIENNWGDLWGRQWFRTIPTEFYGKLGKDSDSFEAWRYFQSLSPRVKLIGFEGISGFYCLGSNLEEKYGWYASFASYCF